MLLTITIILFFTILIIVLVHYGAFYFFLNQLKKTGWKKPAGDYFPKAVILFPLRGADPSLPRSLKKVLTQDYPNYHVRFILDSAEDSVLPLVHDAIEQWGGPKEGGERAEIKIMEEHFSTCTLKCCALYHGIADLDPSYEVVVILDADTNPPSDWLGRLVEPLSDPHFPAATGLRWYVPSLPNAGSLVRYLWNAAAIVQQYIYRIPWGGSLAMRRDLFEKSHLLEQWKHAFTDDTPVTLAVEQAGGKVAMIPSLFLVNREICGLRAFHRWVKRQMLCAKLYHPAWGMVIGQAVLLTLPLLMLVGTFCAGLFYQEGNVIVWSVVSILFYWAGVFGTLPIMECALRQIVRQHDETIERWSFSRTVKTFAMIPVTQFVYTSALIRLHFLRKVEWRGIEYEVTGKQINMVEYKPYTAQPADKEGRSL